VFSPVLCVPDRETIQQGVHNDNDLWQQSNRCHLSSMSIEGDLTITAGEATKMR